MKLLELFLLLLNLIVLVTARPLESQVDQDEEEAADQRLDFVVSVNSFLTDLSESLEAARSQHEFDPDLDLEAAADLAIA